MDTRFVCTLPRDEQDAIRAMLEEAVSTEDVETAMCSRVCDLEDTIDWR